MSQVIAGGLFALASALLWALATVYFGELGRTVAPAGLNLGKSVVAVLCLGALLAFQPAPADARAWLLLGLSGILGISLGDTFFFMALNRLGPRLALLLTTLIPAAAALLSVAFLGERQPWAAWLGAGLTLVGVAWVLWTRGPGSPRPDDLWLGGWYGALTVLCCAAAIVLAKTALHAVPALKAAYIRQLAGLAGLLLWGGWRRDIPAWLAPLAGLAASAKLAGAAFLGTFLGTWLSLAALRHADVSLASTLNSTSVLFALPLTYLLHKERMSLRTAAGAAVAVGGIGLIFWSQA